MRIQCIFSVEEEPFITKSNTFRHFYIKAILVTWAVGYAMLGLDELSHLCEQPFRVTPMYQISKRSMTAVADAFTCRPPPLDGEHVDDEVKTLSQKELTIYWNKQDADVVTDDEME